MNEIRTKLKKGGIAGPFRVKVGTTTRVIVERPRFEAKVLDELGGPVPNVLISVRFQNGQTVERETDVNGRVSFLHNFPEETLSMTLPNLDGSLWDRDEPAGAEGKDDA